jgi:transcriptional regulator with XRE-family HTH domain
MGEFGKRLKDARISKGITLRTFCLSNGLQPSNQSKYERGLLMPPCPEKIHRWLRLLGYKQRDHTYRAVMSAALSEQATRLRKRYEEYLYA